MFNLSSCRYIGKVNILTRIKSSIRTGYALFQRAEGIVFVPDANNGICIVLTLFTNLCLWFCKFMILFCSA